MADDDRRDSDHGASGQLRDPHGALLTDDPHQGVALERRETWDREAEEEHNRQRFGETYRERTGRDAHKRCISYCRAPGQREARRCPTCFGKARTVPIDQAPDDIEPELGLRMRFWAWVWVLIGHACFGLAYPWRLDREKIITALRDELAELVIEVTEPGPSECPKCAAVESAGHAAAVPELEAAPR